MSEININALQTLCRNKHIQWTNHVVVRLLQRGIPQRDVENALMTGKIIEDYPTDYPYPSCLVLGLTISDRPLHVVCGVGNEWLWIVTAYYPGLDKWNSEYVLRKGGLQ